MMFVSFTGIDAIRDKQRTSYPTIWLVSPFCGIYKLKKGTDNISALNRILRFTPNLARFQKE